MNALAGLDVTPNFSFNTIQFENEILNVIVSSVLVAIILNNIASIIFKVVQLSPRDKFSFNACRRFVIFLNSDDPLLLITWWFGKYSFREKHWKRCKQRARLRFLCLPLLARLVLFLASVASIAVTLPTETELSGCENGDFRPILNASQGRIRTVGSPLCVAVPQTTRLGTVASSLKYCSFPNLQSSFVRQVVTLLLASPSDPYIHWALSGNGTAAAFLNRMEWKQTTGKSSFSMPSNSVTGEQIANTILEGLVQLGINCNAIPADVDDDVFALVLNDCDVIPFDVAEDLNSFLLSSIVMERVPEPQARTFGNVTTLECPIDVLVNRPLVNLVPLAISVMVIGIVHLAVSASVARHGNIIDSSYHVMKEVFERDCTSNPLEDSYEVAEQADALPLRRVLRDGKGHVGFLEDRGDYVVEDFDGQTVVSESRYSMKQE